AGAAVRTVDLPRLTGGVLHTKFWLVDGVHLYIGSANMDWRALTQVKELGAAIYNCSCLAEDLGKIFEAYWALGVPDASIPAPWPDSFSTSINLQSPLEVTLNGTEAAVFFSVGAAPVPGWGHRAGGQCAGVTVLGSPGWGHHTGVTIMGSLCWGSPHWGHHSEVTMLESLCWGYGCWPHSRAEMFPFLRSLAALADNGTRYGVQVRLFLVPSSAAQSRIPFARVSHTKYMVTDRAAYVGTSNWSGDYFERTAGSALVVAQPGPGSGSFRERLRAAFERDWSSRYSVDIGDTASWAGRCGPR
ncbi:PLD3 Phospholipase, partial [Calcarius ornatus]|nr:PLD3 Phospholipase [Calcarius ornatus]